MSRYNPILIWGILSFIPDRGVHFRELLRRLESQHIRLSDKTLKKYVDFLVSEGYLTLMEVKGSTRIPLKIYSKTQKEFKFQPSAQFEGELLAKISAALLSSFHGGFIRKIVLFGSVARKESKANSDVDLLVIVEGGKGWRFMEEFYAYINPIIFDTGRFVSLHVYSVDEINELLTKGSMFVREALTDGLTLYERGKG
jgi:predicted nucleotidyltransferase